MVLAFRALAAPIASGQLLSVGTQRPGLVEELSAAAVPALPGSSDDSVAGSLGEEDVERIQLVVQVVRRRKCHVSGDSR